MKKDDILNYLQAYKNSSENKLFSDIGLFGSYARNQADSFSDIDVAIRVNKEYLEAHDIWDYFDAINEMKSSLFKFFQLRSDIFDLDSDSLLVEKIKKDIIYV